MCSVFGILDNLFILSPVPARIFGALNSPTLLCIFGARMYLNMKEAADRGAIVGNWSLISISTIRFGDSETGTDIDKEEQWVDFHCFDSEAVS